MAHFQFAVSGQVLDLLSPTRGISDGLDVNSAEFEFRSKEWENLEKWAHFVNPNYNNGEPQSYELIGDEISSERGLNLTAGIWEVYLTGYLISNGETLKRYVTESQLIMIVQSNIIDESPLASISPTVEEQVYAKAAEAYNAKITSATATVDTGVGVPDVEVSISGANGTKSLDFSFHNLLANGIKEFTVVPSGDNEGYVTIIMENGDTVEFAGIRDALARINALNVTAAAAEVQRVAAEEGRVTAEAARALAEQTRATEFEEWGDFAHYAESYAKGTRGGEDVDPEDPAYHNNSKYYAEQAAGYIAEVSAYASAAATDAERAETARETVESDTGDAQVAALNSEAWAVGQRNGTDVDSGDDTYHNNSKYYALESLSSADAAAGSATDADTSARAAAASATAAATSATASADGEAWAVGKRGGTDVETTDPTYHNNAKYWAEYAEEHADQNQDAFSYVQVGDVTIAADLPQDTLTLIAGDNVTLTPDATNDSITIEASGAVRGVKGNAESTYRTGEINLTPADIGAAPQGTVDDIVVMSDTQPTSPNNRIWIKPGNTISVPTMDDISAAVGALGTDDIDNESTVTGATTTDALNTLKTGIDTLGNTVAGLGSDDIANDSTVTGTTVSDALDEVKGSLNAIQSQIVANVETGTTAQKKTYTTGEYVVVNNVLYRTIAPIPRYDTFTVGTNITAVNVGNELIAKMGSITTVISAITDLRYNGMVFRNDTAFAIGSTGVTLPQWSYGIFFTSGGLDASFIAVTVTGNVITAYRINGNWTVASSVYTRIANVETDVSTLQTDVSTLQTDVSTLQTDVGGGTPVDITTSNTNFTILNSSTNPSQYVQRGKYVEVNCNIRCEATVTGSQAICKLPASLIQNTLHIGNWSFYGNTDIKASGLFQNGTLYISGATAGNTYQIHFVYMV